MPPQSSCASPHLSASPQPHSFSLGDHVLCKLRPNSEEPPVFAQIIALGDHLPKPVTTSKPANETIRAAVARHASHRLKSAPPSHPTVGSPRASGPLQKNARSHARPQPPNLSSLFISTKNASGETDPDFLPAEPFKASQSPQEHLENPAMVYVHFLKQDHRLDRWESLLNVTPVAAHALQQDADQDTHNRTVTRAMRRAHTDVDSGQLDDVTASEPSDPKSTVAPSSHTPKVRNVSHIVFGNYKIDTWYYSKIHLTQNHFETLYVCPTCLALEINLLAYAHHLRECIVLRPPGRLIYDDAERDVRVYEIDAYINQMYCIRFARIAKFFIEHKVICYDICPFMFYIATVRNEIAGYFSKERPMMESDFNVSCILTFPQHQRKGIGSFLIALSYELSRREGKTGTPERPLSDLGRASYTRYWTTTILKWLRKNQPDSVRVAIRDISAATGITEDDIIAVLKEKNMYCVWKSEKCAEVCHKHIDTTLVDTPLPKIPLRPRNFRTRLQSAPRPSNASGLSSSSAPATPSAPSTKTPSKKTSEASKFKISVKYEKSKSCISKTFSGITANESYKKKQDHGSRVLKYSPSQEKKIIEFIEKHSPRRVLERLGSEEGISHEQLKELAKSLGKDPIRLRKKLLRSSLIMSGDVKLKDTGRARCLSTKYVLEQMQNERGFGSWSEEKMSRSTPGSSSAFSDDSEANDLDGEDGYATGENDHDIGQSSVHGNDYHADRADTLVNGNDIEREVPSNYQDSNYSGSEDHEVGADDDLEFSGLGPSSPGPAYYYEESEDESYLDNTKGPDQQSSHDGNKRRVKFNKEVLIKGGVVVIDD